MNTPLLVIAECCCAKATLLTAGRTARRASADAPVAPAAASASFAAAAERAAAAAASSASCANSTSSASPGAAQHAEDQCCIMHCHARMVWPGTLSRQYYACTPSSAARPPPPSPADHTWQCQGWLQATQRCSSKWHRCIILHCTTYKMRARNPTNSSTCSCSRYNHKQYIASLLQDLPNGGSNATNSCHACQSHLRSSPCTSLACVCRCAPSIHLL